MHICQDVVTKFIVTIYFDSICLQHIYTIKTRKQIYTYVHICMRLINIKYFQLKIFTKFKEQLGSDYGLHVTCNLLLLSSP